MPSGTKRYAISPHSAVNGHLNGQRIQEAEDPLGLCVDFTLRGQFFRKSGVQGHFECCAKCPRFYPPHATLRGESIFSFYNFGGIDDLALKL